MGYLIPGIADFADESFLEGIIKLYVAESQVIDLLALIL